MINTTKHKEFEGLTYPEYLLKNSRNDSSYTGIDGKMVYDCDICQDTGTVEVLEQVEPGEPHLALIGVRKCICAEYHEDRNDDY